MGERFHPFPDRGDSGSSPRTPKLTERARPLLVVDALEDIVLWERIVVPHQVDGSHGTFRAPRATCTLSANNDFDAVHTWLALHESATTQRTYRKEAERLILWAVVERGKALSSLTTDDAVRSIRRRLALITTSCQVVL